MAYTARSSPPIGITEGALVYCVQMSDRQPANNAVPFKTSSLDVVAHGGGVETASSGRGRETETGLLLYQFRLSGRTSSVSLSTSRRHESFEPHPNSLTSNLAALFTLQLLSTRL